jgi:hypothetical protein
MRKEASAVYQTFSRFLLCFSRVKIRLFFIEQSGNSLIFQKTKDKKLTLLPKSHHVFFLMLQLSSIFHHSSVSQYSRGFLLLKASFHDLFAIRKTSVKINPHA